MIILLGGRQVRLKVFVDVWVDLVDVRLSVGGSWTVYDHCRGLPVPKKLKVRERRRERRLVLRWERCDSGV